MTPGKSGGGRFWPWFIVLMLSFTAGAQGVLLYAATHDRAFAIEPDYYKKAVAWDSSMALARENVALGWTATARFDRDANARARLRVTLRDSAGTVVRGARVRVTAVHNLEAARPTASTLAETGDGAYEATMARAREGLWEIRIDAYAAGHRFTPTLRAELVR